MSEYQYYEFLAMDQPLTDRQMLEIRSISTRARITPTSFVNEYHWGDFKGDIDEFMTKYFDVFVYYANWGTRDLRFRLPKAGVDMKAAEQYCLTDQACIYPAGDHVILSLGSDDEEDEWDAEDYPGWMSSLAPLRADLLACDFRCLYLGWLHSVGCGEFDDDEAEPPIPPGLGELTLPLRALVQFLRIDNSLIEAASDASPPLCKKSCSDNRMRSWIKSLPAQNKDALLYRLTQVTPAVVQRELIGSFRQSTQPQRAEGFSTGRTVGGLLAAAELLTQEKRRIKAENEARQEALCNAAADRARQKKLDILARREPLAWGMVDSLIAKRQPNKYDEAVRLLLDLRDLADRQGQTNKVVARIKALREKHANKRNLISRMDDANL